MANDRITLSLAQQCANCLGRDTYDAGMGGLWARTLVRQCATPIYICLCRRLKEVKTSASHVCAGARVFLWDDMVRENLIITQVNIRVATNGLEQLGR